MSFLWTVQSNPKHSAKCFNIMLWNSKKYYFFPKQFSVDNEPDFWLQFFRLRLMLHTIIMFWYKAWAIDKSTNGVHKLCSTYIIWENEYLVCEGLDIPLFEICDSMCWEMKTISFTFVTLQCVSHKKCHRKDHENVFCNIGHFLFSISYAYQ